MSDTPQFAENDRVGLTLLGDAKLSVAGVSGVLFANGAMEQDIAPESGRFTLGGFGFCGRLFGGGFRSRCRGRCIGDSFGSGLFLGVGAAD